MRNVLIRSRNGRMSSRWATLGVLVVLVHVATIGGVELFWYGLTGGFSPLMALFGFVAAILICIRLAGEARAWAVRMNEAGIDRL